jgi:predicted ferric reductase
MTLAPPAADTLTRMPAAVGVRARRDAQVRAAAAAVLTGGLLLPLVWWIQDDGLVLASESWAGLLTGLGQLAGLAGSVLLLAQVVLMARVPALERAYGQDGLARVHRLVGFTSFNLVLAHVVVVTWGYAGGALLRLPAELWDLTWDYPGMLLAAAGTVALVLVVTTSVRAARRRLRYESWHLLHLYAYLGAGLALPHQLWTGADFTGHGVRTVLWWTAWGAALAAVLVWRVAVPLLRSDRHRLTVTSVVPEGSGVHSVYLGGRDLDRLPAAAGQFVTVRFGGPGVSRAHPYSLSAAPDGRSLRVTVQAVGDGSATVRGLRPGVRAYVEGPYGRLTDRARVRRGVALVGAGVGVAPLRALAEGLDYEPGDAVLLHRFRDEPLFARELEVLARERGLVVHPLPGARRGPESWLGAGGPWPGAAVAGDAALAALVPDLADRDVFVCGPPSWTALVCADLRRLGVPAGQVHVESFAW